MVKTRQATDLDELVEAARAVFARKKLQRLAIAFDELGNAQRLQDAQAMINSGSYGLAVDADVGLGYIFRLNRDPSAERKPSGYVTGYDSRGKEVLLEEPSKRIKYYVNGTNRQRLLALMGVEKPHDFECGEAIQEADPKHYEQLRRNTFYFRKRDKR